MKRKNGLKNKITTRSNSKIIESEKLMKDHFEKRRFTRRGLKKPSSIKDAPGIWKDKELVPIQMGKNRIEQVLSDLKKNLKGPIDSSMPGNEYTGQPTSQNKPRKISTVLQSESKKISKKQKKCLSRNKLDQGSFLKNSDLNHTMDGTPHLFSVLTPKGDCLGTLLLTGRKLKTDNGLSTIQPEIPYQLNRSAPLVNSVLSTDENCVKSHGEQNLPIIPSVFTMPIKDEADCQAVKPAKTLFFPTASGSFIKMKAVKGKKTSMKKPILKIPKSLAGGISDTGRNSTIGHFDSAESFKACLDGGMKFPSVVATPDSFMSDSVLKQDFVSNREAPDKITKLEDAIEFGEPSISELIGSLDSFHASTQDVILSDIHNPASQIIQCDEKNDELQETKVKQPSDYDCRSMLIASNTNPWVEHFRMCADPFNGYVNSHEQLKMLLSAYERETQSKFVVVNVKRRYANIFEDIRESFIEKPRPKICWSQNIFTKPDPWIAENVPCVFMGSKVFGCQFGIGQPRKTLPEGLNPDRIKRRRPGSKKLGCLARIKIVHKVTFPKYKHPTMKTYMYQVQKIHGDQLLDDIICGRDVGAVEQLSVQLPLPSAHTNHIIGEDPPLERAKRIHKPKAKRSRKCKNIPKEILTDSEEIILESPNSTFIDDVDGIDGQHQDELLLHFGTDVETMDNYLSDSSIPSDHDKHDMEEVEVIFNQLQQNLHTLSEKSKEAMTLDELRNFSASVEECCSSVNEYNPKGRCDSSSCPPKRSICDNDDQNGIVSVTLPASELNYLNQIQQNKISKSRERWKF